MPIVLRSAALAGFSLVLAVTAAQAQHGHGHGGAAHGASPVPPAAAQGASASGSFAVRSFGAFRAMVQKQDYAAKARLGDVKAGGATEAVGAVSGLRGEITMIDGHFIVTYGGGCKTCPPAPDETAALLGAARVAAWREPILLATDMAGKALDNFIISQARAAGVDVSAPFPVRLTGELSNVEMHVNEAPNPDFTGHGSKTPMAKQDDFRHASLQGEVVGLYAPPTMQGVLTHPGEPFHFHWVDTDRTRTAHLDSFGMKQGAKLLLPAK